MEQNRYKRYLGDNLIGLDDELAIGDEKRRVIKVLT
jgi:hypothetical protein